MAGDIALTFLGAAGTVTGSRYLAGHLQEEEARYANKRGFSKHRPALPSSLPNGP